MLNLDIPTLNLVLGVIIPLLVGAVTRLKASAGVKAVINAGLSAVAGVAAAAIQANGAVLLKTALIGFLTTWGISILTYYGLWKPTGVTATVQQATAKFGVGQPTTLQTTAKPVVLHPATINLQVTGTANQFVPPVDGFIPPGWEPGDPPLGELADDEDDLDACGIDMAAHAIPEGTEAFYAMSPDGDEEKLKEYDRLFNGPKEEG